MIGMRFSDLYYVSLKLSFKNYFTNGNNYESLSFRRSCWWILYSLLTKSILCPALKKILFVWPAAVRLYHKILQGNNSFPCYLLPPHMHQQSLRTVAPIQLPGHDWVVTFIFTRWSWSSLYCSLPTASAPQAPTSLYNPHSQREVAHFIQLWQQEDMLIRHQRQRVAQWM